MERPSRQVSKETKPDHEDSSPPLDLKIIQIPSEKIGFVIGKGGSVIKSIQSTSGAFITINAEQGNARIKGNPNQIKDAEQLINQILDKSTKIILIKQHDVGLIMGAQGRTIKHIQEESGASCKLLDHKDSLGPGSQARLSITGTTKEIDTAKEIIHAMLLKAEEKGKKKREEFLKNYGQEEKLGQQESTKRDKIPKRLRNKHDADFAVL